ncbi:hypothetical protein ABZ923_00045 [Streptomyces sp. NPDC046881]|uniref:hypothetical protein n=1 Tax=Streptomyces sp. NPDC046881 TaxID=3155374 RepID=UPI0033CB975F
MSPDTGSAVDHYDRMLAEHYTWMLGGDLRKVADRQAELLAGLGLTRTATGTAVDLGCGSGAHPVVAVDTSHPLLDELLAHVPDGASVRPVHGDLFPPARAWRNPVHLPWRPLVPRAEPQTSPEHRRGALWG